MERNTETTLWIADLYISELSLFRDQRFAGYCILNFVPREVCTLEALTADEYQQFMHDLLLTSRALRSVFQPDHMNYELLGNSNPHLHWHIIPRYKTDPRWGQPVWEDWPRREFIINRYVLPADEYTSRIETIRGALAKNFV